LTRPRETVTTDSRGADTSDRRAEVGVPADPLHGGRAGALAARGEVAGPVGGGSGARPPRRGELARIADALERIAGAIEGKCAPMSTRRRRVVADPIAAAERLAPPDDLARERAARALRKLGQ
jgi:hypothetical protein